VTGSLNVYKRRTLSSERKDRAVKVSPRGVLLAHP